MTDPLELHHLVTERALQDAIVDAARVLGWWVHHQHDSRHSAAGWPDLVLLKPPRALFVELKREAGKVSPHQTHVLELLADCNLTVAVIRPSGLSEFLEVLAA